MSALHLWSSVHAKLGITRVHGKLFFFGGGAPVQANSEAKRDSCPKGGGIYTQEQSDQGVKVTTHLHSVPRSKMCHVLISIFCHRVVLNYLIKHWDNFILTHCHKNAHFPLLQINDAHI